MLRLLISEILVVFDEVRPALDERASVVAGSGWAAIRVVRGRLRDRRLLQ